MIALRAISVISHCETKRRSEGRTCPRGLLEPFFEPEVAEDLPHAWPDANTGADFGELRVRLVDVHLNVRTVLLQDEC